MNTAIQTFLAEEDGASTVDFVMLTAALIGLALSVSTMVTGGVADLTNEVATVVADRSVEAAW